MAADPRKNHQLQKGDIMTVYHPHSGLPARIDHAHEYKPRAEIRDATINIPQASSRPDHLPWHPFNELLDFEFAEVAQDAHLSHAQIDKLLTIINKVAEKKARFTLKKFGDLKSASDKASNLQSGVRL